ncbi:hypothetical protein L1987_30047 [Smallanthus sonchifolius]|uniref:Uncharacterized protein n=1 Tax=Smallanthus sonchifolius TaxID=185202 RepID=A0ACB9I1N1_9ASTR|nr:hypothetical protein L1987_30047 [Smallanthus sonchifolius]
MAQVGRHCTVTVTIEKVFEWEALVIETKKQEKTKKGSYQNRRLCCVLVDPSVISLGNYQKAYVYKNKTGGCAAFVANDDKSAFVKEL